MSRSATETAAMTNYRTLRERIIAGDIDIERRLYESALTTELGTSRTPIREALTMLEKDGILTRERRGYRIRRRSTQEILDYFDVRGALEAASAEAAALRATELERAQMVALLRSAAAEADDVIRSRIHQQWHHKLHEASHNEGLVDFITRAETMISLHRQPWRVSIAGSNDSQAEHEHILDAVLQRDAELARRRMVDHMSRARDFQLQALSEQA
ncbi:GntR family transcriptional regulator [Microbacterium saperdae]